MNNVTEIHYFFAWGRHPDLAAAEVLSTLKRWNIKTELVDASIEAGIIKVHEHLPEEFIDQLGGSIKFGIINYKLKRTATPTEVSESIAEQLTREKVGKTIFGLSQYRAHNLCSAFPPSEFKRIGKNIKEIVKQHGPVRWVVSKDRNLSSVVVHKNKLTSKGKEFVLLHGNKALWIGHTLAVQPYEEYSNRDYGRVAVDPFSGMLPPKLAHIMLNISGVNPDEIIVDPFCGSGTVLQEAIVMGWHHVVGADISMKAIKASKANTDWIKNKYGLKESVVRLFHSDVRELSTHFQKNAVNGIITEPYLGPALKKRITKDYAKKITEELEALYFLALIEFTKFLKDGGKVVIAFPVFILSNARGGLVHINLLTKLKKYGYSVQEPFLKEVEKFKLGATTPRKTYIYGRPKQKLWREIIVFEYNRKK